MPVALFMSGALGEPYGKMGYGVLRYLPNPIACIIDPRYAGRTLSNAFPSLQPKHRGEIPIVGSVSEALGCGSKVVILGIAPSGGKIPKEWFAELDLAVSLGLSMVNGLHEPLKPRYPDAKGFIWDVRVEPTGIEPGTGAARLLNNRRILMVGTDMAVGKMTAGLELWREAKQRGIVAEFVATGQIGITVTGDGIPLDAIRVDYASGAVEGAVLKHAEADWIIIEGQGALCHPGSTSPLPLLRGSCATDMILCCRAGQNTLFRYPEILIPKLRALAALYEDLGESCGTFTRPIMRAVSVNTAHLEPDEADVAVRMITAETGLPACDPVRHGAGNLIEALG